MPAHLISGRTGQWEIVIGMEVHAHVTSKSKLFSGASTAFGAEPNTQVSLVDAAMPGMLPVINRFCVEQAVRTGLGLKAQINLHSVFDRKNYFYPDLPAGYQISQYKQPVVGEGALIIDLEDGTSKSIGIERLHLEQDAGKSLHDQDPRRTFVDLNRAGVALMEIVSKPDLRSAEEAGAYLGKLRSILRYLGTCDGDMEKGSLRADVNVSVRRAGEAKLGTRCEIKNVNSIRFIKQAVEYESQRQVELLENGGAIVQETRLFDSARGETRPMRSKEEAHDYRYFPDPDLLPLVLDPAWVEDIKRGLPELPDDKKERWRNWYGLSLDVIETLVRERDEAITCEQKLTDTLVSIDPRISEYCVDHVDGPDRQKYRRIEFAKLPEHLKAIVHQGSRQFGNLAANNVPGFASTAHVSAGEVFRSADVSGVAYLLATGTVSGRSVGDILQWTFEHKRSAQEAVDTLGLKQITDTGAIEAAIDAAIAAAPGQAAQYKAGNAKVAGWFVGQVMKATGGKANPKIVNEILAKKLGG